MKTRIRPLHPADRYKTSSKPKPPTNPQGTFRDYNPYRGVDNPQTKVMEKRKNRITLARVSILERKDDD